MPITAPPSPDDTAVAAAVPTSGKERALGALGGVLAAGGGKEREDSPLVQAMQKHHQQRIDLANKHYKDYQTYTGILATGNDPETGKPLTAENAEKYYNLRQAAGDELEKTAGVNKDVKGKLQRLKMLADHIVKVHPKSGEGGDEGGGQDTGAQATGGGGSRTAPPPSPTDSLKQNADLPRLRQEMQDQREFNFWKKQQETLRDFKIEEEKAKAAAKESTARTTYGPAISVSNARQLAREGKTYNYKGGKPIDLTALPDSMGLKFISHGGEDYYEPFSPNSKVLTVGNETYAISPMDVEALSRGAGTDLGQHRTPTASSSVKGVDEGGRDVTKRASAPETPGVKSRTAAPPAPSGGTAKSGSAGGTVSGGDLLPSPQNAKRIAPIREANTQLFGDPTQPSLKSLGDYAAMADDPKGSAKVASAVQLTLQKLGESEKKAGSLMTLLQNYGGVPKDLVDSQVALMKDVVGKLSPKEMEAYNTIISSFSSVIGLRSLTGASAAKFSTDALERDIPIPGFNVFSKAAFRNKMSKLAEEVYSGSRTVPATPAERKQYKENVEKYAGSESSAKPRTAAPPKPGSKMSVDDEIMQLVGAAKSGKP